MGNRIRIQQAPFNNKRYILNRNTGVSHDLDNYCASCMIYSMDPSHVYASDYLYLDIKEHPLYEEECDYCMNPDG
ncbi:hypothetical protein EYY48_13935 [Enterococcus faecalis]|uniref:hypothetical protein n=1 Tax=Enterococcus TaxID=1350 RepID=UPI000A65C46B|nr:hypothetical protein [Enterococcus faecalis]MBC2816834.1 hypothetical protein [Enterococcus faecalis]MBC2833572.1 hypothetical protein [Enterococcus faecalis]MBC2849531.1 hypothetical protein [Enterococcus faecalis]